MRQRYEVPGPGELFDPAIYKLGAPCKRNHPWDEGVTLRTVKGGHCPICKRIDALDRQKRAREADREGCNAKAAAYKRQARADGRMPSRSKHDLPYGFLETNGFNHRQAHIVAALLTDGLTVEQIKQRFLTDSYIKAVGRLPSVARLVMDEQRRYWREHPEERKAHLSQWGAYYYAWRYKVDSAFRKHECQRNSGRKAANRGNHTVRIPSGQLKARFAEFENRCAYCNTATQLVVEHFIPRSKGGPHAIGNLLPACNPCNTSKRDHDPEQWYQSQPFFSKTRWRKILTALGKRKTPVSQLPLL